MTEKLRNRTTVDWQFRDSVEGEDADFDQVAFEEIRVSAGRK